MKSSRAFVEKRREKIVQMTEAAGRISISYLAEILNVSDLTIRRDIDALEQRGLVYRRYGEAICLKFQHQTQTQTTFDVDQKGDIRDAIAKRGARFVTDGETIFVNTSSTALQIIEHVNATNVTIVTNSTRASEISAKSHITILVTGGQVFMPRGVLSGEFALNNIKTASAHGCFVGCAGISATAGITSTSLQEATINATMMSRSDTVYLLADSSKIGVEAGFSYAQLSQIDVLITDTLATKEQIAELRVAGIPTIIQVNVADLDTEA